MARRTKRGRQYTYRGFKLYKLRVKLRGSGKTVTAYFFSKRKPKRGTPVSEDEFRKLGGKVVVARNGVPFLRLR